MNEDIIGKARGILKALGYRMAKRDAEILALCCEEAEGEFLSACGLRTPPRDGVRHIAMRAAGEFLTIKKSLCRLDGFIPDCAGVKSVSEGDASVAFRDEAAPLDEVIGFLKGAGKPSRHRKLTW